MVKEDKNTLKIREAIKDAFNPPCYIEFSLKELSTYQQKIVFPHNFLVHPLDSIKFDGNLILVIDKKLYPKGMDPRPEIENPEIQIEFDCISEQIKCCVNRYRTLDETLFNGLDDIPPKKIC